MMYRAFRGDIGINICHVKERKKPCLWLEHGNRLYKVGNFMSDKSAENFWKILTYMIDGNNRDEASSVFKEFDEEN